MPHLENKIITIQSHVTSTRLSHKVSGKRKELLIESNIASTKLDHETINKGKDIMIETKIGKVSNKPKTSIEMSKPTVKVDTKY